MNSPHVAYSPSTNVTTESEARVLANVYRFILDSHAKKKATRPGGPDDAEESKNDRTAEPEYNR